MNDSSSFPLFWRSPIGTLTSYSGPVISMPGSTDQETNVAGNTEKTMADFGNGLTEHRTHQYVNRPEGEMDMMVGFFLMNGFCVSFFLLFGLCVIFSCLRKRPSFLRRKQYSEADPVVSIQEDAFKPKLKSIVSQVIKSNKVSTRVTVDHETSDQDSSANDSHVTKPMNFSRSPTPSLRKTSLSASRQASFDQHSRRCSTSQENSAMIRHNLLGPLSFDDLYYM